MPKDLQKVRKSRQNSVGSGLKFSSESKLFGRAPLAPEQLLQPCTEVILVAIVVTTVCGIYFCVIFFSENITKLTLGLFALSISDLNDLR